ncbi:toll/interleukin-1 receptor domain-containing protein [Mesorhizobium sp.]|uniref:toll/interleukin-1 receptor domain-containing protein n=1 Tax=Mesorhizobium sp. TaxID=1871066 RepID=UPI0025E6EAB0|nr:toll/interleukin-1 receptor domain-containing protein [Mesorhizobium sp.]
MRRLPSDSPDLARRLDILQGRIDDGSIEPWMAVMLAEQIRQRAARSEPLACEDHVARAEIESLLLDPNMLDMMKAQVDGPWDLYADQTSANRQAANLAAALLELSGEQSLNAAHPTTPDSDETGGPMQQRQHGRRFDVAVSCAGPDRQFVREVVQRLLRAGLAVYYDDSESNQAWMVGRNLEEATLRIYREESSCCAVFLSTHYAASRWTRAELAAALERNAGDSGYVRPVRLDDTVFSEIPQRWSTLTRVRGASFPIRCCCRKPCSGHCVARRRFQSVPSWTSQRCPNRNARSAIFLTLSCLRNCDGAEKRRRRRRARSIFPSPASCSATGWSIWRRRKPR